ncbi:hypothetical protein L227DRAFT_168511 [Lentinus tigrinus ALCF2SS1-6]|uniref:Uncharacterized protein n=1 Tax=Lentinus tigrinus ALCF2SS1-6 TaxID=1328759 RepID=A0A5C2RY16_9APHY|nr:hypothetical protein L227DRAFT_289343 [Lentinus tigrinus ALCF2SS1-6]RPD59305.1 hypothetical protein L227DRAFT_168511 [Lentinus tigrinus ALCF2SS1-6]
MSHTAARSDDEIGAVRKKRLPSARTCLGGGPKKTVHICAPRKDVRAQELIGTECVPCSSAPLKPCTPRRILHHNPSTWSLGQCCQQRPRAWQLLGKLPT